MKINRLSSGYFGRLELFASTGKNEMTGMKTEMINVPIICKGTGFPVLYSIELELLEVNLKTNRDHLVI